MDKGKPSLQETHLLSRCNISANYWGGSKGNWTHKGFCWLNLPAERLHYQLGYFPDINVFSWKLDWTCDCRHEDGHHPVVGCSVCAQPEQMTAGSDNSHRTPHFSGAAPERCTEISTLWYSWFHPKYKHALQPVQISHGSISYLVSVSKILTHKRLRLCTVGLRTLYPLV